MNLWNRVISSKLIQNAIEDAAKWDPIKFV